MSEKQLPLAKRVQDIMARENTIGTLKEALFELGLENEKRRDLERKLFDEQLKSRCLERKMNELLRDMYNAAKQAGWIKKEFQGE